MQEREEARDTERRQLYEQGRMNECRWERTAEAAMQEEGGCDTEMGGTKEGTGQVAKQRVDADDMYGRERRCMKTSRDLGVVRRKRVECT